MSLYYEIDDEIKIYHGDCFGIMDQMNDDSFDLILTDPPYGTTGCEWDKMPNLEEMWNRLKRVGKSGCTYVFTASQPFTSKLVMSNLKCFKYEWIWDKHIPRGFQVAKYRPMMRHESVLVFSEGKTTYNPIMVERDKPVKVRNYSKGNKVSSNDIGKYNDGRTFIYTHKGPDSIIGGCWEANKGKVHPTQKPISLMEYLIKTYTNEGDLILDPFMGSGSTLIAAKNLGRRCIGIEQSEEYCEAARLRLDKNLS